MNVTTAVGVAAALCTTSSYFPRLRKCWKTGSTGDLSLRMFLVLGAGVALWILYGVLQSDAVIIVSNSASLAMLGGILYFKVRQIGLTGSAARRQSRPAARTMSAIVGRRRRRHESARRFDH
jgi:MtN3 and saliva related transmembrane protein